MYLVIYFILLATSAFSANIGLLVMATGKYISFVEPLINSAESYFCKDHNVTYFIFTDGQVPIRENVVSVFQSRLGWPYDTMMRYHSYFGASELLAQQDYLFACDADMRFCDVVGDEILGERVATQHPAFVGNRGTYETNPASTACIYGHEGTAYYAGGFYGGTSAEMLQIFRICMQNVDMDLSRGHIAVWHDESHWNRYCIDHKPTVVLTPSYCYPESWGLPYHKRLLALDKNHGEFRAN